MPAFSNDKQNEIFVYNYKQYNILVIASCTAIAFKTSNCFTFISEEVLQIFN